MFLQASNQQNQLQSLCLYSKQVQTQQWEKMNYSKVQFNQLRIKTARAYNKINSSETPEKYDYPRQANAFTIGGKTEMEDFQTRLNLFKYGLKRAVELNGAKTDSSVLKVFVMPEFFFRGPIEGYSHSISPKLVARLHKVVKKEISGKGSDWLIIAGSMIINLESITKTCTNRDIQNLNIVPTMYVDQNKTLRDPICLIKKENSGIDYCDLEKHTKIVKHGIPSEVKNSYVGQNLWKDLYLSEENIVEVNGVKVGVEISLDHDMRRIGQDQQYLEEVDVHIVVSCGMIGKIGYTYESQYTKAKAKVMCICDGASSGLYLPKTGAHQPPDWSGVFCVGNDGAIDRQKIVKSILKKIKPKDLQKHMLAFDDECARLYVYDDVVL